MKSNWFRSALESVGITEVEYQILAHQVPALSSEYERLSRDSIRGQVRSQAFAGAIRWAQGLKKIPLHRNEGASPLGSP